MRRNSRDTLARKILRDTAAKIDSDTRKAGKQHFSMRYKNKHPNRWCPCRCLICGTDFGMLTNYHAATHGYVSAEAMIAAGKVRF